jgi:5-hydroxyisourate hydrolase
VITLSTHVLDSATGRPATGMTVRLETETAPGAEPGAEPRWAAVGGGSTDADGRLKNWGTATPGIGNHRLIFDTGAWFAERGRECFYPEVIITFAVKDDGSHYHVPLLLAAYAYSTYRGS